MVKNLLPAYITQYFWGDTISELDIDKNRKYIVQTLLEIGNSNAIRWLFSVMGKQVVKDILPTLKLSQKSDIFWKIYLS